MADLEKNPRAAAKAAEEEREEGTHRNFKTSPMKSAFLTTEEGRSRVLVQGRVRLPIGEPNQTGLNSRSVQSSKCSWPLVMKYFKLKLSSILPKVGARWGFAQRSLD